MNALEQLSLVENFIDVPFDYNQTLVPVVPIQISVVNGVPIIYKVAVDTSFAGLVL